MKSLKKVVREAIILPADVSLEFSSTCQRGEQLECRLTLKSQESVIEVKEISVALMAEENVEVDAGYQSGYASVGDEDEKVDVEIYVGTVTSSTITVNKIITVSDGINLDQNRDYSWKANFVVPRNSNPTYHSDLVHHKWYLCATITLAHRNFFQKKNFSYRSNELIVS